MIVTTARSSLSSANDPTDAGIGFLDNPKRFNVAVTRAKRLMVIVGDSHMMARVQCWREMMDHAKRGGAFIRHEDVQGKMAGEIYRPAYMVEIGSDDEQQNRDQEEMRMLEKRLEELRGKMMLQQSARS